MSNELFIKKTVTINAAAMQVWDALVNPEKTKQYMYGCEAISDWKVGSPLLWNGVADGKTITYVKGNIVSFDPGKRLQFTVFDPHGSYEDIPSNYLHVTYELFEDNGKTTLTVTQGDYSKVAEGEKRYQHSLKDWDIIQLLKEVAEK
ncbi:MAG: hypothetical protein EPO24_10650 [Bacteroidetes bacterium]|nr:MAG: hypothetical protein EPO24_10650 [Bacteroidota bacterium]